MSSSPQGEPTADGATRKHGRSGKGGWQGGLRNAGPYLGTGMQLAGTVGVYVLLGWLADRWLDTQPWLLVTGGVLGMVAFFVQLARLVRRMNADTRSRLESGRSTSDAKGK